MSEYIWRKPSWMDNKAWESFAAMHRAACAECGVLDRLSVDHIVPRSKGGTDDLSNLQPLCIDCNRRKSANDDSYWRQRLFFDASINLAALRTAQREHAWEPILRYADWFTTPWSQINRLLYVPAWVVGAGKTLGIPVIAFALNHVMRREHGDACPRVDRILVLCKETAIRDQLALDLKTDMAKYGILSVEPNVKVVQDGEDWGTDGVFDNAHIVVACLHQLWERKGGRDDAAVERTLASFPLIVFDEPHYAQEQVLRLTDMARASLCFGFTGTPINAEGDALKKFVLFSLFDYRAAVDFDQSMKFCSSMKEDWLTQVKVVDIEEATVIDRGYNSRVVNNTNEPDYKIGLVPAKTVVESVVAYVKECEAEAIPLLARLADHRPPNSDPTLFYPIHALISVDGIQMGRMLTDHLNDFFERDRRMYPREKGYYAEMIHSDTQHNGKPIKGNRLDPKTHPWLRYKATGKLDAHCARFLLVDGMGREGVNNPYCGVVGAACSIQSIVEHVQRTTGRQLRSVSQLIDDILRVPPRAADSIKIITHKAFGNEQPIREALSFVTDMGSWLAPMPKMEDVIEGRHTTTPGLPMDTEGVLHTQERIDIAAHIGDSVISGFPPDIDVLVDVYGGKSEKKRKRVFDWADLVQNDPWKAAGTLGLTHELRPRMVVMREVPQHTPTGEEAINFLKRYDDPQLLAQYAADPARYGAWVERLYKEHIKQFHLDDIRSNVDINSLRLSLAGRIKDSLRVHVRGSKTEWEHSTHELVGSAVKQVLGVDEGEKAKNEGRYDKPQFHAILVRPEVQNEIIGWVQTKLIERGYVPALAAAFGLETEYVFNV